VKRRCRDVHCVLIFVVYWLGMLAIAGVSLVYGDPLRLVYATGA